MGVKAWITVNGNHIPIMDGESKMEAVGRFIKSKRTAINKKIKDEAEYNRQVRNSTIVNKEAADMRVIHPKDYNKLRKETLAKLQDSNQQYNSEVRSLKKKLSGRQLTQKEYAEKLQDLNDKYRNIERREGYNLTEWTNSKYKDDSYRNNAIVYRAELKNIDKEYHAVKDKMNDSKQKGTYKLKEDKPTKTSRSKTIRDTNLRVGDTFKNHAGRVASHEAKIIKFKDGKYGLQISGVDGKPYRNTKYASIYQLEDDLKKQGYRYKKDW